MSNKLCTRHRKCKITKSSECVNIYIYIYIYIEDIILQMLYGQAETMLNMFSVHYLKF